MKQSKETFSKAGAGYFRAIAELLNSASVFYEAGYPEEGDKTVSTAMSMIQELPESDE